MLGGMLHHSLKQIIDSFDRLIKPWYALVDGVLVDIQSKNVPECCSDDTAS